MVFAVLRISGVCLNPWNSCGNIPRKGFGFRRLGRRRYAEVVASGSSLVASH